MALKVYSVPVDTLHPAQFFGPKDIREVPITWNDIAPLVYSALAMLILGAAAVFFIMRYRDNKPIIKIIKIEPKLPPHQAAMKKIEEIKADKQVQREDPKSYYTELTEVLRTYIKDRFGFNALEMTSTEIIDHLLQVKDQQSINDLKSLFESTSYKVWLCAHRGNTQKGMKEGIPENSLPAIEHSVKAGGEMIELDARPTSDGVVVLMHDNTIDRTTNGSGAVGDFTYQHLQQFYLKDASGNITGERIPTLEEAMKKGIGKVYYNLDIVNKNVAVNTIVALLKKLDLEGSTLLYVSNNRNYAFDLKAANSSLLLHQMAKATDDITYFSSSYTDNVQMMQLSTSDAMGGTMVNEIKDKGWLLFSNIVGANDTNMLSENYSGLVGMINKRINIVQTDYAEVAAKYLKSKGYR